VLGLDVVTNEDGAEGKTFLRSLVSQGIAGVNMIMPDAHRDLKSA
jgi:transposase-like protein